jgi:hypothetical protein
MVRRREPVQFNVGGGFFGRNRKPTRPLSRADGITAFRNDAIMPVICPTGQVAFRACRLPAAGGRLLCMGLFSIFWQRGALAPLHNWPLLFAVP